MCLAVGLWVIGVSSPLLLGLITAVLAWVPYVGFVLGCLLVVLVAATDSPGDPAGRLQRHRLFVGGAPARRLRLHAAHHRTQPAPASAAHGAHDFRRRCGGRRGRPDARAAAAWASSWCSAKPSAKIVTDPRLRGTPCVRAPPAAPAGDTRPAIGSHHRDAAGIRVAGHCIAAQHERLRQASPRFGARPLTT